MLQKEILIINLGSPQYPQHEYVGAFLKEFLMDKHVLRIPYIIRYLLVNKIIVPKRVSCSTANYSKIWSKENGSPIIYNTIEFAKRLEEQLLSKGLEMGEGAKCLESSSNVKVSGVSFAMRYGECSISNKIKELASKGVKELLVVPMYPQCEDSTYITSMCEARKAADSFGLKVNFIPPFYNNSDYISALANSVKNNRDANIVSKIKNGELDKLLISFHGIPIRCLPCGAKVASKCINPLLPTHKKCAKCKSCYKKECYTTAYLLAEALGLNSSEFEVLFQSRLGSGEWIKPYLAKRIEELPKGEGERKESLLDSRDKMCIAECKENISGSKIKRVAVIAPSFTADCLETLSEIDMEIRELFLDSGGEEFYYIPALNFSNFWVAKFCNLIKPNL